VLSRAIASVSVAISAAQRWRWYAGIKIRRQFARLNRAYPKTLYPIRRLLRRNPEFVALLYHQALRVERILLPARMRVLKGLRRRMAGRR
jgi:hypothetical protein